jgi:hypothetical protein
VTSSTTGGVASSTVNVTAAESNVTLSTVDLTSEEDTDAIGSVTSEIQGENDKIYRTPDAQENSDNVSDVASASASGDLCQTPEGEFLLADSDKNAQGAAHQIIDDICSGSPKEVAEGDSVVVEEVSEVKIGYDMMSKYFSLSLVPVLKMFPGFFFFI